MQDAKWQNLEDRETHTEVAANFVVLAQAACGNPTARQALVQFVTEQLRDHGRLEDGAPHLEDEERDSEGEAVMACTSQP